MKKMIILILFVAVFLAKPSCEYSLNVPSNFCELYAAKPKCDPFAKYRTINGFCNNLQNPKWGAENNVYQRVLKARFRDGVSQIPESVLGGPLPSARKLSVELFSNLNTTSDTYSMMLPLLGGFLVEDEGSSADNILGKPCCFSNGTLHPPPRDPACLYIPIDKTDPTYAAQPRQCMNFLRSTTDFSSNCPGFKKSGPANAINTATAYLDLSAIYGVNDKDNKKLRKWKEGLLATRTVRGAEFPLNMPKEASLCPEDNPSGRCYLSGDLRMNGFPGLASVSVIFIREHNRLARELKQLNPHWNDEKLFQEARRINIAQYQYIIYYQYYAEVLGKWFMKKNQLIFHERGDERVDDYDPFVNINMLNEHSTAAHRHFHTVVSGQMNLISEHDKIVGTLELKDTYFRPSILETDNVMDDISRGMCRQATTELDSSFDDGIREFLFRGRNKFGSDIKAIDIQRGRDHGLGSYNDAREYCGLPRATSWSDFADEIRQPDIDKLKKNYKHPDDVDLSVGGAFERIVADSACGRTFQCLIARQVYNSRVGDRFWFETADPILKFTRDQLREIRKASMARIYCDNGKTITKMQRNVFRIPSEENPAVGCEYIPKLNLRKWKEEASSEEV